MTLNELACADARKFFNVVDVLRVVGQELFFVLEELDEGVSGGTAIDDGKNVLGETVECAWEY